MVRLGILKEIQLLKWKTKSITLKNWLKRISLLPNRRHLKNFTRG